MKDEEKEIKICDDHLDYETPIIWTFAFNGAEYWCPHCGYTGGMLGAGTDVPETKELKIRLEKFQEFSYEFLNAIGTLICSQTEWGGKLISPNDLPQKEKDRLRKIIDEWEYEIKVEDVELAV